MDKLSYALGLSIGQNLRNSGVKDITFVDFLDGVQTVFNNGEAKINPQQANQILKTYFEKLQKEQEAEEKKTRAAALLESEEYLKENAKKDLVRVTKSGLQYRVLTEGTGKQPNANSRVKVHYEGRLTDGTVFDSSYKRGEPTEFGLGQVISGWTEGLQLMKEGSVFEFTIPPQLGYGENGIPGHIPGNTVLIFKVELLNVL